MDSNVEVDYMEFGCRFGNRVEVGCNDVVYPSDRRCNIFFLLLSYYSSSTFLNCLGSCFDS